MQRPPIPAAAGRSVFPSMSVIERDEHCGPVPAAAREADALARETKDRVEVFNVTRAGGLDKRTMDLALYEAIRGLILEIIDEESDDDGTVLLKDAVAAAQARYGSHELFPNGRVTNYVRYTKVDLEARCEIERIPRSSPQRITRLRPDI